jgi:hypothetical protein
MPSKLTAFGLFVVTGVGCAGLVDSMRVSKDDKWGHERVIAQRDEARALKPGHTCKTFQKAWHSWKELGVEANNQLRNSVCNKHPDHAFCADYKQVRAEVDTKRNELLHQAVKGENPDLDASCLRGDLMTAYWHPELAAGLDIDAELDHLAKRLAAAQSQALAQAGSLTAVAREAGEGRCITLADAAPAARLAAAVGPGKKKHRTDNVEAPPETVQVSFDRHERGDIVIRCATTTALDAFTRDDPDTLVFNQWWDGDFSGVHHKLVAGEGRRVDANTIEFRISPAALAATYERLVEKAGGTTYDKPYYSFVLEYVVWRKNGQQEVRQGSQVRLEDNWDRNVVARGAFLLHR